MSSRGISGDFRNPTALVRVFLPPEKKSKNITLERDFYESLERDFYESLQRDFFWRFQKSHSSGPSFFFLPRESEKITPQRDFLHFPSGALMAMKANISSRGIFHISPLELSWQ